jgi:ATP-dependent helicase/nuclease subunit A
VRGDLAWWGGWTLPRTGGGEIQHRILKRLAEVVGDEEKAALLAKQLGREDLDQTAFGAMLLRLVGVLDRLRIGTLDSFFMGFAGAFWLELGLPAGWSIGDETEQVAVRAEAIDRVLDGQETVVMAGMIRKLNRGRLSVPVHRQIDEAAKSLYALWRDAPDPESWGWLDNPKLLSDDQVETHMHRALELAAPLDDIGTKVHEDMDRFERKRWPEFLKTGIAAKICAGATTFGAGRHPIPDPLAEAYRPLIEHARHVAVDRLADQNRAAHALLERYSGAIEAFRNETGVFGFDDVTRILGRQSELGLSEIYYRLDASLRHLLLDEFQDTSVQQWQVLRPMADEIIADATGDHSFFCVGDVKQAIYGWRGGNAAIFDGLENQYGQALRREAKTLSYRSSPVIIDTVNRVFDSVSSRVALKEYVEQADAWATGFDVHDTDKKQLQGFAELLIAPRGAGAKGQAEATLGYAVQKISQLHHRHPGRSLGVLVRTNDTVARLIHGLRQEGVFASEEGGNRLTDAPAVCVVLSLLRLADHPDDRIAAFHVGSSPLGVLLGVSDYKNRQATARVSSNIRTLLSIQGYGPVVFGLAKRLASSCDARNQRRLGQLCELAASFAGHKTTRPTEFVAWVESTKVEDPVAADIRIMTVHQAKGLEFDIVVLPELNSGFSPWSPTPAMLIERPDPMGKPSYVSCYVAQSSWDAHPRLGAMGDQHAHRSVADSLSLLYVALTRAVHAVHMIIPPSAPKAEAYPANYAGLLSETLSGELPVEDGSLAWSHGEAEWDPSVKPVADRPIQRRAKVRVAVPTRLVHRSPSQLEGGSSIALGDRMGLDQARSLDFGSAIHALFEQIRWMEDLPGDDVLAKAMAPFAAGDDARQILNAFGAMCRRDAVVQVLSKPSDGSEPKVMNEYRFSVKLDGVILSGTFDRLELTMDQGKVVSARVMDYKTDAVDVSDGDALDQKVAYYKPQLAAYRKAVEASYGLGAQDIETGLLFVTPGHYQVVASEEE